MALPSSALVLDDGTITFNEPPPTPSYISIPERIRANKPFTISCGVSIDPDGDTVQYVFEVNADNAGYMQAHRGDSNTAALAAGNWNTVKVRAAAVDENDNYSAYVTSPTRTVDHNQDPTISVPGGDKGVVTTPFEVEYSVNDPDEGDALTVTEALDGMAMRVIPEAERDAACTASFAEYWPTLRNGSHALTITVMDDHGDSVTSSFTFVRNTTRIVVQLKEPYETETQIRQVLATVLRTGGVLTVEACNNAYDDNPAWEVITQAVLDGRKKLLANEAKTADKWGYNMRVSVDPSYNGELLTLRSVTCSLLGGAS